MPSLRSLYRSHTGKVSDKWDIYIEIYDRIFAAWQDRPVTLVEVGVQNGGSLEIWSRYFVNARRFIGCDIDPKCAALTFDDPRIALVVADVNSPEGFRAIHAQAPSWDIFIDDGSHTSRDIIHTFFHYFPFLKPGGLYVIEDLHCSYWPRFGGGLARPESSMAFLKSLADAINHEHWRSSVGLDDLLAPFFPGSARPPNALLTDVFGISFFNSLCVIEKRAAGQSAGLGPRVVAGDDAQVSLEPLYVRASTNT